MLVGAEEGRLWLEVSLSQVDLRVLVDEHFAALRLRARRGAAEAHSAVVTFAFLQSPIVCNITLS